MPKSPSNSVFRLVKSMSSHEKRYFTLFALMPSGKSAERYLQLFRVLETQQNYDEPAAMNALGVKNQKQFSDLKNYLFQLILKTLRIHGDNHSSDIRIKNLVIEAELLHSKGLLPEVVKVRV